MAEERITVVTGSPRCGSSLVMRMLVAGGMRGYYDYESSYETEGALRLPDDHEWLLNARGACVKILEPLAFTPPRSLRYNFILLTRDPKEQAKSNAKFAAWQGFLPMARDDRRAFARSIAKDVPRIRKLLRSYPDAKITEFRFEALVGERSGHTVALLPAAAGWDRCSRDQLAAMQACVEARETTGCLPYMLEERIHA